MAKRQPKNKVKTARGIKPGAWEKKPATYNQTARLAKETGRVIKKAKLCTWLDVELNGREASDLIGRCIAGEREEVRNYLIHEGALLWDAKEKKTKPHPASKAKNTASKPKTAAPKLSMSMTKAELLAQMQAFIAAQEAA